MKITRTVEENLIVVYTDENGVDHERDATPADLDRAGFAPLAAFVGPLDLLSPPTLAGALEAVRRLDVDAAAQPDPGTLAHLRADLRDAVRERDELRHHYDAAAPEHNLLALLDSYESDADTARAQASAAYAMVVAAIGSVGAETIEAAVARLVADRGALVARAEKAERERDEARAELARLTAPADGEPSGADLRALVDREGLRIGVDAAILDVYRLGVAHERARHAPAPCTQEARATDEELERDYSAAYAQVWGPEQSTTDQGARAGIRAVAARVRQERCLVAQAVAANVDIRVCEDDGGGFMLGVHESGCDEELARCVPAAEVPATLASLLGGGAL